MTLSRRCRDGALGPAAQSNPLGCGAADIIIIFITEEYRSIKVKVEEDKTLQQ